MVLEPHAWLARLPRAEARAALERCCACQRWVERMLTLGPFGSLSELLGSAEHAWSGLSRDDYLQAFAAHPQIGADLNELRQRFAMTAAWSSAEQAGVAGADDGTLLALAEANRRYRERFGYIFIICATGKSASALLAALLERLENEPERELAIAAGEQAKITRLRLEKLGS